MSDSTVPDFGRAKRKTLGMKLDEALDEIKCACNPTESYAAIKAARKILTEAERRVSRDMAWVDEAVAWGEQNRMKGIA